MFKKIKLFYVLVRYERKIRAYHEKLLINDKLVINI